MGNPCSRFAPSSRRMGGDPVRTAPRSDAVVSSSAVIVILTVGVSSQAPAKAPAWTTVTSREGDFRIEFPSRPQEQAKVLPGADGDIEQKIYYARAGGC